MSLPKFRVYDELLKEMYEVSSIEFDTGKIFYKAYGIDGYWNKDAILMQSTGLKDKNGVEIYEGDVVHYTSSIMNKTDWYKKIVRHGSALLMVSFDERSRDSSEFLNALSVAKGIVVIGNIYENPELLEELR